MALASAVVMRLKRMMSFNMRKNFQFSKLRRWANTLFRLEPLHSSCFPSLPAPGTFTENDMSDLAVSTPSSANRLIRFG